MSRRTARAHSSGQKRKHSDEDIGTPVDLEESPSKTKKSRQKLFKDDLSGSQVSQTPELMEEGTQTESSEFSTPLEKVSLDNARPRYSEIEKRAIDARRRLDASITQQHDSSIMKKSMALLKKTMDLHFKSVTARLQACQKSNKRLENEIEELKLALVRKKTQRPRQKSLTDKQPKPVKGPRPHTVVVTVPDEQLDDQLRSLKAEQKETENTEEIQELEEELIVDQKEINYEGDPKPSHSSDGNFTFITLNSEEDYPNGSWLGDVSSPAMRVRCKINPTEMVHIMNMYKTADKLALKLLDLLFDKEMQAVSNLSGTGKHKKKKLDPLLIYGIHCHLVKHCGITHEDWYRIRQNIDSKCRTAFRRKQKGLELYPKQIKKERSSLTSPYTTEAYQHSHAVHHLQQVVNELQTIPSEGLTGIAIIQEQPDGSSTVETASSSTSSLVGHILNQDGGEIAPDQLKEVIAQAGNGNEIHLTNGQTIAISQSGELEIREVHLEVSKE
ncbi:protein BANP isoform X2 [Strongylocentrotus purpuratus]|uniref:Protein BANP n=1 Tax=Strongylocentrotus purpuratus TaxID=7668 RepID=A0A7M7N6D4_STRPU|nr:protein BANP isoform X2 [Strongylocentrotus purpuratus]